MNLPPAAARLRASRIATQGGFTGGPPPGTVLCCMFSVLYVLHCVGVLCGGVGEGNEGWWSGMYSTLLHSIVFHFPSTFPLCSALQYLFPPSPVLFCSVPPCVELPLLDLLLIHLFFLLFLYLFIAGPEAIHGGIGNSNGTGNVFDISTLRMSRSDYHMSDEEASVGTQRDFLWGVIMGYFLGMYVHVHSVLRAYVYMLCFVRLG
jgi:hypothetical protein